VAANAPADPFAVAAATVRSHDYDRYLSDLFITEDKRRHIFALHAFNAEVARVREAVSDPQVGEIRLQWWRDALIGDDGGHPVARAVKQTIDDFKLPLLAFERLLDARVFDLYDDPMPALNDLEGYAGETSSSLMQLAAIILAGGRDPGTAEAAGHAGVAYAITGLLRALPVHARRGQQFLPRDLMAKHGADAAAMFEGRASDGLVAVLAELRARAREHVAKAEQGLGAVPAEVRAAFLPLALVEPYLGLMERRGYDPLHTVVGLPAWRRPWILWRAARRL
jgi:phytoene synthase